MHWQKMLMPYNAKNGPSTVKICLVKSEKPSNVEKWCSHFEMLSANNIMNSARNCGIIRDKTTLVKKMKIFQTLRLYFR
jgi:hypothetical protein